MVEEGGFEPPKSATTDLQSAPFGHSGTPPYQIGAGGRTRTPDLLITNQLLYQLSYTSIWHGVKTHPQQRLFYQKISGLSTGKIQKFQKFQKFQTSQGGQALGPPRRTQQPYRMGGKAFMQLWSACCAALEGPISAGPQKLSEIPPGGGLPPPKARKGLAPYFGRSRV